MARLRLVHRCTACTATHPKWAGQCGTCGEWNSLVEDVEGPDAPLIAPSAGAGPQPIADVSVAACPPIPTGLSELDRVLGDGIVAGSVTLLGGEPGIGKSTLLLQLLAAWPGRTL